MQAKTSRITDPRFLFFGSEDCPSDRSDTFHIELDYRYLRPSDLPGLLLERIGIESINVPHAIDTIEDHVEKLSDAHVTISRFRIDTDTLKANDTIGMIQIIAYVVLRAGSKIRFYLKAED
jgi:hypothetical protein